METNLTQVAETALAAASEAADLQALDEVRVRYLGRKGQLTRLLKSISALPAEQRPAFGQAVNQAKKELEGAISKRQ
ncbi:MAG: phenylalanine--tRNA ligase subunit alpha, partial [Deltaproteobacteria bacterium]|nr:phenylalanine--tRNA ligase subunit alpha [Deltaproteobacteria bacterium]